MQGEKLNAHCSAPKGRETTVTGLWELATNTLHGVPHKAGRSGKHSRKIPIPSNASKCHTSFTQNRPSNAVHP